VAVLLVGPPGCGKTTLAMAFAEELPGTLHHLSSQKCHVAALDRLTDLLAYYPSRGKFHFEAQRTSFVAAAESALGWTSLIPPHTAACYGECGLASRLSNYQCHCVRPHRLTATEGVHAFAGLGFHTDLASFQAECLSQFLLHTRDVASILNRLSPGRLSPWRQCDREWFRSSPR